MSWNFERVAGPYKGRTGGLAWTGKAMLFSAVTEERVLSFDPKTGKAENFRRWTGRVNGLAIAKDASVYAAQEGGRRIVHFLNDGSTAPTEELLDGAHHNQPVDLVIDKKGSVWFADPYNSMAPYGPPAYPYLPHASVIRMDAYGPGRYRLTQVTHDTLGPRAVLLSSDEKTLYVADGDVERGDVCQLLAYPLNAHGTASHPKTLLTFAPNERGIEGMCFDSKGNIVACLGWSKSGSPASIIVVTPGGTIVDTQAAPADQPMRCAFGDTGLKSLYLTAGDGCLYRATDTGLSGLKR